MKASQGSFCKGKSLLDSYFRLVRLMPRERVRVKRLTRHILKQMLKQVRYIQVELVGMAVPRRMLLKEMPTII